MSLSILLADDEPLVTQAMRVLISEINLDISVVGELHDGDQVLDFIKTHQPDGVLLDIRMPHKNGFEILDEIERHQYDTKVIILSAYRDFEYAQKALHYGAVEYLTKPLNKTNLEAALRKLFRQYNENRIIQTATTSHCLNTLLQGGDSAKEQFEQWDFFKGSLKQDIQLCMLFFPDPQSYEYYKSFKKRKAEWMQYLYIMWINEYYWILIYKAEQTNIISSIKSIRSYLRNVRTYVGISPVMDCTQFPTAYDQALEAVLHSFYNPSIPMFLYSDWGQMSQENIHPLVPTVLTSHLGEKIDLGITEDIESIIHTWFHTAQLNCLHPSLVYSNIKQLLHYLQTRGSYTSKETEALLQQGIDHLTAWEVSQNYGTCDSLEQWTIDVIVKLSRLNQDLLDLSDQQRIIRKAKSYCERHYKDDISLDVIAREMHITKSWFCVLFKKETGQTFGNYLTDLRLKKATVLLATSEMKISKIAESVGYKNASHFNHAFIEKYKQTPLEYRRAHWNALV